MAKEVTRESWTYIIPENEGIDGVEKRVWMAQQCGCNILEILHISLSHGYGFKIVVDPKPAVFRDFIPDITWA